jgi:GAF domain-containing protein
MDDADPRREFERLRTLRATGLLDGPARSELQDICRRAQEHFQVAAALVTLVAQGSLVVKACAGLELAGSSYLSRLCEHTIRSTEILVVPDARQDLRFRNSPVVAGRPDLRFYAGAPLAYVRDCRLGALCVVDHLPRTWSAAETAELIRLADEAVSNIMERQFDATWGSTRRESGDH